MDRVQVQRLPHHDLDLVLLFLWRPDGSPASCDYNPQSISCGGRVAYWNGLFRRLTGGFDWVSDSGIDFVRAESSFCKWGRGAGIGEGSILGRAGLHWNYPLDIRSVDDRDETSQSGVERCEGLEKGEHNSSWTWVEIS